MAEASISETADPESVLGLDRNECLKAMDSIPRNMMIQFARRLWLSDEDLVKVDIENTDTLYDDIKQGIFDKWIEKYGSKTSRSWFVNALQGLGFYTEAHELKYEQISTQEEGNHTQTSDSDSSDLPEVSADDSTPPRRPSIPITEGPVIELKPPCEIFTGKKHIECYKKIGEHYKNNTLRHVKPRPVLIEILYGLGGVGKTEILCQYIWNQRTTYTGGVFVLNGQSNIYMDYGLKKLLKTVKVDLVDEEFTPRHIRRAALAWLHKNEDWLLVIDNVYDPELIKMYFPDEPPLQDGHVIITSRIRSGWNSWYNAIMTHVYFLSPEDSAVYLLQQKMSVPGETPCSCEAAEKTMATLKKENLEEYKALLWLGDEGALHGLPLALYQASRYIQLSGVSFQRYKNLYFKCRLDVFQKSKTDLLETWLKFHDLDPSLVAALRGVVGSNTLLLKTLSDDQLKDFMSNQQLVEFKKARADTDQGEFVHMVDPSKDNILTTWKMNYDQLCRDKVAKEFLHLCSCLSSRVQVALLVDGAKYLNPSDLKDYVLAKHRSGREGSCTETTQRILKLFQKLQQFSFADIAVGQSDDVRDTGTLNRLGAFVIPHLVKQVVFLELAGQDDKIQSLNNAMNMLEKLFPKLEDVQADKVDILYSEAVRDRHSIIAFHTVALGRQMQSLEEDDITDLNNTNAIFTSVGTYLRRLGRARDAKSLYKLMATLSEWRKPQRHEQLAEAMQGLGRILQNNVEHMGDEEKRNEVEKLLTNTLDRKLRYYEETGEQDHYSVAHAYHQLGRFYQDTGRFAKAQEYLIISFEMRTRYWQRKYGTTESVDIAVGMTNLARNYLISDKDLRKMDEATEMLLKALKMKYDRMPNSFESYQLALYYLAAVYREKGDIETSQKYLSQIEMEDYIEKYKNTANETKYALVYPSEKTIWM